MVKDTVCPRTPTPPPPPLLQSLTPPLLLSPTPSLLPSPTSPLLPSPTPPLPSPPIITATKTPKKFSTSLQPDVKMNRFSRTYETMLS